MITAKLAGLLIFAVLIGCASDYRPVSIGQAQRAVRGQVVQVDPVVITRSSGAGAGMGATLAGGGVATGSDNIGFVLAGMIGGAIIGELAERAVTEANGARYLIKTETDSLLTVVQLDQVEGRFETGQRVALVYGYPSQLVPLRAQLAN